MTILDIRVVILTVFFMVIQKYLGGALPAIQQLRDAIDWNQIWIYIHDDIHDDQYAESPTLTANEVPNFNFYVYIYIRRIYHIV